MAPESAPEAGSDLRGDDCLPGLVDDSTGPDSEADESSDGWYRGRVARRRLPRAGSRSSGPQSTPLPTSPPPVCPPCSPPGEDGEELTHAELATARMLLADPAVLEAAIGRVFDERLQQGDGEAIDLPVVEQLISDASAVDDVFAAVFPPPVTAEDCLARGWPTAAFDRCCCATSCMLRRARGNPAQLDRFAERRDALDAAAAAQVHAAPSCPVHTVPHARL